jgi:hypothetical protein
VTRIHIKCGGTEGDLDPVACPTGCAGSRCGKWCVPHGRTLMAECYVGNTLVGTATQTFMKNYSPVFWVIGGILFIGVLIWLFKKRSSANR